MEQTSINERTECAASNDMNITILPLIKRPRLPSRYKTLAFRLCLGLKGTGRKRNDLLNILQRRKTRFSCPPSRIFEHSPYPFFGARGKRRKGRWSAPESFR